MKETSHTLFLNFFRKNLQKNNLEKIKKFATRHELIDVRTTALHSFHSLRTPADYALEFAMIEAMDILIENGLTFHFWGVDPDTKKRGLNALIVLMKLEREDIVNHLLENHPETLLLTRSTIENDVELTEYLRTHSLEKYVEPVKRAYATCLLNKAAEFKEEATKLSQKAQNLEKKAQELAPSLTKSSIKPVNCPPKRLPK